MTKSNWWHQACVMGVLLALPSAAIAQPQIVFNYSYDSTGFFQQPGSRGALETAATRLTGRLTDTLTAITPGGSNSWQAAFLNPQDGSTATVNNLTLAQNAVVVFVGARSLTGSFAIGSAGGYAANGDAAFNTTVATRGQTGAGASPATDYGPWGGSITFHSDADWHFDTTTAPSAQQVDLSTAATHELARVLGFGTSAAWNANVSAGTFVGPISAALYGEPVPLDTDLRSWESGVSLDGRPQLMQQDIPLGRQRPFGELDYAGLSDVGWQVTPVPEPSGSLGVAGIAAALAVIRRQLKGASLR